MSRKPAEPGREERTRSVPLDDVYVRYLTDHQQGRLATIAPDGSPQNKPVGYSYNAELGTIDIAGFNMERSAKYRNVRVNPAVSFVVDDAIGEGASGTRFLEIRGTAEQVTSGPPAADGLGSHLIRIHPSRVVSWNVDPAHPGMLASDVGADGSPAGNPPDRPSLAAEGAAAFEAAQAAASLVGELQAGWDAHDADVSNRHFAADIIWGSPFGATVHNYEDLHAIHVRLKHEARGGSAARFEIVKVVTPAPGVALAQVRRIALGDDGEPVPARDDPTGPFSEMALYVLVRRGRTWWLAAGQNTPLRFPPSG
jgi:PPOX class F420-dependent enzyme/OxyR family protein